MNSPPVFYVSDSGHPFDCHVLCGRLGIPLTSCSLSKTCCGCFYVNLLVCLYWLDVTVKCKTEGTHNTMVSFELLCTVDTPCTLCTMYKVRVCNLS